MKVESNRTFTEKNMKYLIHAGPWSDKYLDSIVKEISSDNESLILSAHKKVDHSGLWLSYYQYLKANKDSDITIEASNEDLDIVKRCRLLRALKLKEALLHLYSMRKAVIDVFDNFQPDIVLTETIDSYVMDLLYFEANKRGIHFLGLVGVFLNGYYRISARGEYNKTREPTDKEVIDTLRELEKKDYLPAFVVKDKKKPTYSVLRKWARTLIKVPYFYIKRWSSGDYYNYHYWYGVIGSIEWSHVWPKLNLGSDSWSEEVSGCGKKVIYIPLQMFPEATVDYWCQDVEVIDYDNVLCRFIANHPDLHFLIKEHPNVIGYRNPSLYKRLHKFDNVSVCPTQVNSNSLFNFYDAVLVWTGTVGFESALRGKPVFCFAAPYYFPNSNYYLPVSEDSNTEDLVTYIQNHSEILNASKKKQLVKHSLSSVLEGRLIVDGSWDASSPDDMKQMKVLARSLGEYIERCVLKDV